MNPPPQNQQQQQQEDNPENAPDADADNPIGEPWRNHNPPAAERMVPHEDVVVVQMVNPVVVGDPHVSVSSDDEEAPEASTTATATTTSQRKRNAACTTTTTTTSNTSLDSSHPMTTASSSMKKRCPDRALPGEDPSYISPQDWFWDHPVLSEYRNATSTTATSHKTNTIPHTHPVVSPSPLLWGQPSSSSSPPLSDQPNHLVQQQHDDPEQQHDNNHNNPHPDDDPEDNHSSASESSSSQQNKKQTIIPSAWLNAGFSMSGCGTGVALSTPTEDDIAYYTWKERTHQPNNNNNNNATDPILLPPFHCRSTTALTSIVTALIQSNLIVQDNQLTWATRNSNNNDNNNSNNKKQHYEQRLTEALTVLLWIAARASTRRKQNAILSQQQQQQYPPQITQIIQSRLQLCQTCTWKTTSNHSSSPTSNNNNNNNNNNSAQDPLPSGRDSSAPPLLFTSLTHTPSSLKSYVKANLRAFMGTGGLALFLETILHIHGVDALSHLLRSTTTTSFISCQCETQFRNATRKLSNKKEKQQYQHPLNTDCMSVALLSLLLTGHVYHTFEGWSTGDLGIGMLVHDAKFVCQGLSRPSKPIYILKGPTSYSVLWLLDAQDEWEKFQKSSSSSHAIGRFRHWQCWEGGTAVDFRLETTQQENGDSVRSSSQWIAHYPEKEDSSSLSLWKRRQEKEALKRREQLREEIDPRLVFTNDVLEFQVHPEDRKLYPDNYRLWRYKIRLRNEEEDTSSCCWLTYYRLKERPRILVEERMGLALKSLLWKRWPLAIVDQLDPPNANPVV